MLSIWIYKIYNNETYTLIDSMEYKDILQANIYIFYIRTDIIGYDNISLSITTLTTKLQYSIRHYIIFINTLSNIFYLFILYSFANIITII